MPRLQQLRQMTRVSGIALMTMLTLILCLPLPIQPATISGPIGETLYLTETDTLDVKILKENGVRVLTQNIIGAGTLAQRNATTPAEGNLWILTDSNPPNLFTRYSGGQWGVATADSTYPIATQTLTAAQQIAGCGTDRATIRMVYVQGSGGPVTLTSNPQIPAGIDGQVCVLWGASASATLTVADGNGIELDGVSTYTVSNTKSLTLAYSTNGNLWRQIGSSTATTAGGGGSAPGLTSATTLASLSGATATATNLIPANSWVFGVTINVATAVTGATGINVGNGTDPTQWGSNIAVSQGTTTNIANFLGITPSFYPVATNVVLTAVGSNFTGGTVGVTVYYMTLASFVSGGGGGGESGLPPGGSGNAVLKRSSDNTTLEWAQIAGTADQIDVSFTTPGTVRLVAPQNLAPTSSPAWAGQTITQGTLVSSTPLNHTAAFNNAGVTFVGETHDYTDTASAAASQLVRYRVGGVEKFAVRKDGEVTANSYKVGLVTVTSASYTVATDVTIVLCNAASNPITITLPAASARVANPIIIKKIDTSSNNCTITRAGSDTIEGATTLPLQVQYQKFSLVSGGGGLWLLL